MAVNPGAGREALTTYRVLERLPAATLVEAKLHSGRTHQIRVHFKHIGYPLLGDATYGKRQNKILTEIRGYSAPRQMLHAYRLGFLHPRTRKRISFEAGLPQDFQDALNRLRQDPSPG
jgi:23S rRNA pseudouridine1911/1915/1917 synthase